MPPNENASDLPVRQLPSRLSQFPLGQALPYTQVRKGVELSGEVLVADTWQPELGVIKTPSALFRIVFLTRHQEVSPQAIAHGRVAVCIPAPPTYQLRDPQTTYQMVQTGIEPGTAISEEAVAYSAGHIVAREALIFSPPAIFAPTQPADWVERIVAALFPATWEAAQAYASLLLPEIKASGQPGDAQASLFTARLRDWEDRLGRLASNLAEVTVSLGPPADNRFKEAIDHLARVCDSSDYEEFCLEAVATYGSPSAMASGLALMEKLAALASHLPEVLFVRNYLSGAVLSDGERELAMDRQSLLEQVNADYLLSNPHLWPSLKTLFDWFKARYRSAYLARFRQWQAQMLQLQQLLQDKEREVQALRHLNSIAELGEPVGEEVLKTYSELRDKIKTCPVDSGVESLLDSEPVCHYCGFKLTDEAPAGEVSSFIYRLESALKQQLRRLSSRASHLILSQSREPRLQKFLQITQASDLSSLPLVLDDRLVAFIRQLLREAK